MSGEVEYTLLQKKECLLYEVPPSTRASGHLAAEWTNCVWKGKMKISARAKQLILQMLTPDNEVFMGCGIDPNEFEKYIERTTDSSRYFVLRVANPTGGFANVGLGFTERNDAFDFWACLIDFKDQIITENTAVPVSETEAPRLDHLRM